MRPVSSDWWARAGCVVPRHSRLAKKRPRRFFAVLPPLPPRAWREDLQTRLRPSLRCVRHVPSVAIVRRRTLAGIANARIQFGADDVGAKSRVQCAAGRIEIEWLSLGVSRRVENLDARLRHRLEQSIEPLPAPATTPQRCLLKLEDIVVQLLVAASPANPNRRPHIRRWDHVVMGMRKTRRVLLTTSLLLRSSLDSSSSRRLRRLPVIALLAPEPSPPSLHLATSSRHAFHAQMPRPHLQPPF